MTVGPKRATFSPFPLISLTKPPRKQSLAGGVNNGFDPCNSSDPFAARRDTKLAAQSKLGLWAKRWNRIDSRNHHHPVTAEGDLVLRPADPGDSSSRSPTAS